MIMKLIPCSIGLKKVRVLLKFILKKKTTTAPKDRKSKTFKMCF